MLKDIPIFSCLDDQAITELERVAVRRHFPKNAVLFSKGDESDSIYIVDFGKVKAVIHDEEGREIILNSFGPRDYFGEVALLDGEPRSATMITKDPTQVLIIYKRDFQKILLSNTEMVFNLLRELLKKLRDATDKIENLAFKNVYGRIVNLLLQLAKQKDDYWVIDERLTHQEIANMVGSSREMVSKIMKELVIGGYITSEKKRISIRKKLPSSF